MKIDNRKGALIFLSFVVILFAWFSVSANTDPSEKSTEREAGDGQKRWDEGFDTGWDRGWDDGWKKGFNSGWDSGWHSRGDVFPNFDESSKLGLKGIKKLRVMIFRSGGDDYDSIIRNYVELRLRSVGIEIIDEQGEDLESALISVTYLTEQDESDTRLRIQLRLHQDVLIPRRLDEKKFIHYLIRVCTRVNEKLMIHTPDPKALIKEFLQEEMDRFTNDWLKENQKTKDLAAKESE